MLQEMDLQTPTEQESILSNCLAAMRKASHGDMSLNLFIYPMGLFKSDFQKRPANP